MPPLPYPIKTHRTYKTHKSHMTYFFKTISYPL